MDNVQGVADGDQTLVVQTGRNSSFEIRSLNTAQINILSLTPFSQDLYPDAEKENGRQIFFHAVRKRSEEQSTTNIAGNFDGYVEEPSSDGEVTPILVKSNFYRGETILEEKNYAVAEEHGRKILKKKGREVEVHLQDIHKHGRYIILVGGAGSGKTTLIKRYTSQVLQKKITKLESVDVVHLVNVRDLSGQNLTPKELLFGKLLPGAHLKKPIEFGYEWMQDEKNQPNILLAFDGIDTAPWTLTEYMHELINYDDEASADTIMYNILHGHLFPKCWILLTSREYGITRFPQRIRPDNVIALKGLTTDSIKVLVEGLAGDDAERIWKSLQEKSLNLMLLCSTPLFLVFTVIVYKKCPDNPPDNLSGIIITLLESHIHSDHSTMKYSGDSDDYVRTVIDKLKKLSLHGLQEGKVVFTSKEIEREGLNVKQVKDLVISVPTPSADGVYKQRVVEEDYSLFFCHQAFQESLAALCIANKPLKFFKKFTKESLHMPHYVIVRQILCGVLFNPETTKLAEKQSKVEKKAAKQKFLLETMEEELKSKVDSPMDMLNLLNSLRECGDQRNVVQLIRSCIKRISLDGIPLTPSDLHAASVVARHCERLDIMQLVNCHLDSSGLEVLADGMKGSDVEITVFDISFNGNIHKEGMADLYEICRRGRGLNYWQCGFRQIDILTFNQQKAAKRKPTKRRELSEEEAIGYEFDETNVLECSSYNVETYPDSLNDLLGRHRSEDDRIKIVLSEYVEESSVEELCSILRRSKHVKELCISECDFTERQLRSIQEAVCDKELESLNVFLNRIGEGGWSILGNITNQCKIKTLFLTACNLTEGKLRRFQESLNGTKIYKLDISRNDDMDKYAMQVLAMIVEECHVQELIMGYCQFTSEHMQTFDQYVGNAEILRIDMSGNDGIGESGFSFLGNIADKCKVKQLDISECDPSSEEIRSFREAAVHAKITKLNVSRNTRMQQSGLEDVGKLVDQCQLKELFIRQCALEEITLNSFKSGLGSAKISSLDLGYYFMKPRKTTKQEIEIVKELLHNVIDQLTLNDWEISEVDRRDLQAAIDKLEYRDLKVMFNRGRNDFIRQQPQNVP